MPLFMRLAIDVIAQDQAKGIEKPWEEPDFIDQITHQITHMQKERQMNATGALQFYDRAPFCTYALGKYLAYWKNTEFRHLPVVLGEIDRCLKTVFIKTKYSFLKIWVLSSIPMPEKFPMKML